MSDVDDSHVPYASTSWARRTAGTDWIADLLDIKATSLHQLVQRGAFPPSSAPRGRPGEWPLVDVLLNVIEHRPQLVDRLPRLFPRVGPPVPALFQWARMVTVRTAPTSSSYPYVVYVWQPSDGRRPVALAYSLEDQRHNASTLLNELKSEVPNLSAVAVPYGSWYADSSGVLQPSDIDYADDSPFPHKLRDLTWFDVAYLLQCDLPSWPSHLRNHAAMLRWQPGDAPCGVVPARPIGGDPRALLRWGNHTPEHLVEFGQAWAEFIARKYCTADDTVTASSIPAGICVPAWPVSPVTGEPLDSDGAPHEAPVSAELTLQVLQSQVSERAFDDIRSLAYSFDLWSPWIKSVTHIGRDTVNPLARQWLARLKRARGLVEDLGYLHVCALAREHFQIVDPARAAPPPVRLVDESYPGLWIVELDGIVSVTIPRSIPTAKGVLQQLDITQSPDSVENSFSAWWADSEGSAWPMHGDSQYQAGYSGAGPQSLAEAATVLAYSATDPLDREHTLGVRRRGDRFAELHAEVTRRRHPMLVRRISSDGGDFRWHFDG
jgi:hypothetical protein